MYAPQPMHDIPRSVYAPPPVEHDSHAATGFRAQVNALVATARTCRTRRQLDLACSESISAICQRALESGMYPEHLIVLMKQEWRAQPVSPASADRDVNQTLEFLITASIKTYYRRPATQARRNEG